MSGFNDILKNGWHPDKDKPLKKQAIGLFKKDDGTANHTPEYHVSRPLSSLRDPASFGAPPRRVALGGGGGGGGGGSSTGAPSRSRSPPGGPPRPPRPSAPSLPPRPGVTSSGSSTHDRSTAAAAAVTDDDDDDLPRAPRTYRVDTTGLNTAHLPPPPVRRDGVSPARGLLPSLPPRLPARATPPTAGRGAPPPLPARSSTASSRTGSVSPARSGNNIDTSSNLINQAAVQRLGRAGIVVPGLGIGPSTTDSGASGSGQQQLRPTPLAAIGSVAAVRETSREASPSRPSQPAASPQISELQARLAKMGTGSGGGGSSAGRAASPTKPSPSLLAAKKKPPPPPPPKKPDALRRPAATAHANDKEEDDDDDEGPPPPIPMATRPQGW